MLDRTFTAVVARGIHSTGTVLEVRADNPEIRNLVLDDIREVEDADFIDYFGAAVPSHGVIEIHAEMLSAPSKWEPGEYRLISAGLVASREQELEKEVALLRAQLRDLEAQAYSMIRPYELRWERLSQFVAKLLGPSNLLTMIASGDDSGMRTIRGNITPIRVATPPRPISAGEPDPAKHLTHSRYVLLQELFLSCDWDKLSQTLYARGNLGNSVTPTLLVSEEAFHAMPDDVLVELITKHLIPPFRDKAAMLTRKETGHDDYDEEGRNHGQEI